VELVAEQKVKSELRGTYAPDHVVVLPLDLTGPYEELEAAARAADAVPGPKGAAGVQYLVHNAGTSCTNYRASLTQHTTLWFCSIPVAFFIKFLFFYFFLFL
jgi:dehydrogenase/reductase SDR family member 7